LAAATVATEDGLSVQFQDADASVTAVSVQGKPVKLNGTPGGFYVADMIGDKLLGKMNYKSQAFPATRLKATAHASPTGVVIEGEVNDLWIRARIESRGEYLAVTGCQIKSAAADHVVLAVPAQWTAVVAINRDDAKALAEINHREMTAPDKGR
jgi:hypothetical protein